jgi:hypothetical protein
MSITFTQINKRRERPREAHDVPLVHPEQIADAMFPQVLEEARQDLPRVLARARRPAALLQVGQIGLEETVEALAHRPLGCARSMTRLRSETSTWV